MSSISEAYNGLIELAVAETSKIEKHKDYMKLLKEIKLNGKPTLENVEKAMDLLKSGDIVKIFEKFKDK